MIYEEEKLEQDIEKSIEEKREKLKLICIDLAVKFELFESKLSKCKTMLEEEETLRTELQKLKSEKDKRMESFRLLSDKETKLCEKLSVRRTEIRAAIPSERDLAQMAVRIRELEMIYDKSKKEMNELQEEIRQFSNNLDVSHSDSFTETLIMEPVEELCLSERDLERARQLRDELKKRDDELSAEIRSLRVRVKELWFKLGIENQELRQAVSSDDAVIESRNIGSKSALAKKLRIEHEKCVKLKMENMQKFVEAIRADIHVLCLKMFCGESEMAALNQSLLTRTDFNEDLLKQHEEKLDDLKFRFEENEELFEKMARWMHVWGDFLAFEETTKDPNRFKARGYSMLEEEKRRKVFNVWKTRESSFFLYFLRINWVSSLKAQLPRLEEDLEILAKTFRDLNGGKEFCVQGIFFMEFINRKKFDHEENKMNQRKEKQILRDHVKRNESRYGCKIASPLALRGKRKLGATHQDTQLQTPSCTIIRSAKQLKTDTTTVGTPSVLGKLFHNFLKANNQ